MSRKRVLLAIVATLVLVAMVANLIARRGPRNQEPFLAEALMPDGIHRLRLLKIVEGPLRYDWKDPVPPLLRALPLPAQLRPRHVPFTPMKTDGLVPRSSGMTGQTQGASFLFRVVDAAGEYAAVHLGVPEMVLVESTGHRFVRPQNLNDPPAHWGVACSTRSVLPRRDPMLKIEVNLTTSPGPPLLFQVENPFYKPPAREWVPEALPSTKTVEGVEVTLHSVGSVTKWGHLNNVDLRCPNREFVAEHNSFWIEDATGNQGPLLSPFEPAWKLHGRIVPRQISVVPAERIWIIDNLEFPRWGEEKTLNLEREIDGVRLRLGTLVGGAIGSGDENNREDGPATSNQSGSRNDCPRFDLTATSSHRDFDVIVRVSSNGKELRTTGSTGLRPLSREITRVFKKLPAGSRVTIEVGVSRPVHVEFLLDPKEFASEAEKVMRTRTAS